MTKCPKCSNYECACHSAKWTPKAKRLTPLEQEMLEAIRGMSQSLRTFRNVPKEEQDWTTFDDDALEAGFAVIAKATR